MKVVAHRDGAIMVLSLHGRLDGRTSIGLRKKFLSLIDEGAKQFVVDGSHLAYVSSSGLRALLVVAKRLAEGSGRLVLCSLNQQTRKVFDITGLTSVFDIWESREEALVKLREEK